MVSTMVGTILIIFLLLIPIGTLLLYGAIASRSQCYVCGAKKMILVCDDCGRSVCARHSELIQDRVICKDCQVRYR